MSLKQKLLYKISRNVVRLYAYFLLNMDIHWHAPLPEGPVLIASNHPSTSDPFYIMVLSRRPVSTMMIESPFRIPVFGSLLHHAGHIPVIPANKHAALDSAHQQLRTGHTVAIFPEGNHSPREGGYLPPRSGAARLALLSGAAVVPVGIYLDRKRSVHITTHIAGRRTVGYWHLKGKYSMTVGQSMHFEGNAEDNAHVYSISKVIMDKIRALARESQVRAEATDGK